MEEETIQEIAEEEHLIPKEEEEEETIQNKRKSKTAFYQNRLKRVNLFYLVFFTFINVSCGHLMELSVRNTQNSTFRFFFFSFGF
jgi:hypothetical protein